MHDDRQSDSIGHGEGYLIGLAKGLRDGSQAPRRVGDGVGPGQVFHGTAYPPRRIAAGIRHHWTGFLENGPLPNWGCV